MTYRRPTKPIATPVALPPDDGLILYLPCQEGSGSVSVDLSGRSNHADLSSSVTWGLSGLGPHLTLNGTDGKITVAEHNADFDFNGSSPFTISAWVFTDRAANPAQTLLDKLGSGDRGYRIFWYNRKFYFLVKSAGSGQLQVYTTNTVSFNVWHHILFTKPALLTAGDVDAYIDGKSVALTVASNTLGATVENDKDIVIGQLPSVGQQWSGKVSNFRIYNRALSGDEIRRIYEAEL